MNKVLRKIIFAAVISQFAVQCKSKTEKKTDEKSTTPVAKTKTVIPERWREEIKLYPDSVALYDRIIDSMSRAGQADTAVAYADSLIVRDTAKFADYFLVKADLLRATRKFEPAVEAYKSYLLIKPGEPPIYLGLANTLAEAGDSTALSFSDEIAERFPTPETITGTYFIKGMYYTSKQNFAEARKWFDKVLERDYTFIQAWMEKGYAYYDEGKKDAAYKHFTQMTNVHAREADGWYWRGKTAEETNHVEDAKIAYQRALTISTIPEARAALDRLNKATNQ